MPYVCYNTSANQPDEGPLENCVLDAKDDAAARLEALDIKTKYKWESHAVSFIPDTSGPPRRL